MEHIICRQGSRYLSVYADTGQYLQALYACVCIQNLNGVSSAIKCLSCGSSKRC